MSDNTTYSTPHDTPIINRITVRDLKEALTEGINDYKAMPTYIIFMAIIYPTVGYILVRIALDIQVIPLVFPLIVGFSFIGPIAAVGLYELSRRREAGLPISWHHLLAIFKSPSIGSIIILGLFLFAVFVAWIWSAQGLYKLYIADEAPEKLQVFLNQIFNTKSGHQLILVGNIVGLIFAFIVFIASAISFPMLIDRKTTAATAVATSIQVVFRNFITMIIWAALIALLLLIGAITAFIGLIVIIPVLGHASWHIYRKAVSY